MSSYTNYCIKPNYFTGVSGWANSSTNDQWLIKNRGNSVSYKQITPNSGWRCQQCYIVLIGFTRQP